MADSELILERKEAESIEPMEKYAVIRRDEYGLHYEIGEVLKVGHEKNKNLVGKQVFFCSTCISFKIKGSGNEEYYIIDIDDIYATVKADI